MAILIPVRKQGQKNRGERIKIESILYVCTHLKITKPKEIFQYKHFFKGEALRLYTLYSLDRFYKSIAAEICEF